MADRINLLEETIAQKIAAGEVVQRPVSVVKELVENSLDAGSSKIEIDFKEDGRDYLRVRDNGWGMSPNDAKLSFCRHATSKIILDNDLTAIKTLGFRGEALASIAAVSEVEMLTRERGETIGTRLVVRGGEITLFEPAGCPEGTEIAVRQLFFNTPARRKFLKSKATETAQLTDMVNRFALANPEVAMALIQDQKILLKTLGNGDWYQNLGAVLGVETAKKMIKVAAKINNTEVSGWVGKPFLNKSNRRHLIFFVNDRPVYSKLLNRAVEEAYLDKLPKQRYPVAIINLKIDYGRVDVNIHPAKTEIRMEDENEIAIAVNSAVSKALHEEEAIPQISFKETKEIPEVKHFEKSVVTQPSFLNYYQQEDEKINFETAVRETTAKKAEKLMPMPNFKDKPAMNFDNQTSRTMPSDNKIHLASMEILGQFAASYIIAVSGNRFFLIDQHAAHERIRYERIRKQYLNSQVKSQSLAVPIPLQLNTVEAGLLLDRIVEMRNYGFILECMEDRNFWLRAVPPGLDGQQGIALIRDLLEWLDNNNSNQNLWEEVIKLAACKGAIKARHKLEFDEIKILLNQLEICENPFTCPHGRPTIVEFSEETIARMFGR